MIMLSARKVLVLAVGSTLLLTTACSSSTAGGTNTKGSSTTQGGTDASGLPAEYKDAGVLKFATAVGYPPMELYREGSQDIIGVDVDIAQAIGTKLGVKVTLTNLGFDGLIPAVKAKRFDAVISSMSDTEERAKQVDFIDYFTAGAVIVVAKGNPENIHGPGDLCGKPLAANKASTNLAVAQGFQGQCGDNKIKIQQTEDAPNSLLQLQSGRAVAVIVDFPVAVLWAAQKNTSNPPEVLPEQYQSSNWGVAVAKDSGLKAPFQKAMDAIMADGTYAAILKKWNVEAGALNGKKTS